MAKITIQFEGLKSLEEKLNIAANKIDSISKAGLYDGASIALQAAKDQIASLPDSAFLSKEEAVYERQELLDAVGVEKHEVDDITGEIFTKISFMGYQDWNDNWYYKPPGRANLEQARSINAGTTKRTKNKFMDKATKECKKQVKDKVQETIFLQLSKEKIIDE